MEEDIAILMADLTGYTAMTEVHGGASAAKIVRKYMALVDGALAGSAKVTQRIGDQVVIISQNAEDILHTAVRLNQMTGDEHEFLAIHAGLHYGPVFIEGNSIFGSTINIASRIMNVAQRGQILGSQAFCSQLSDASNFKSIGFHKLKNVIEEFELFQLLPNKDTPPLDVDPVCHMQLDKSKPHYLTIKNNITYHFCSEQCRSLFENAPETFISNM